jgi:hypothetical protein
MSSSIDVPDTFANGVRSIISVLRPKGPGWQEVPMEGLGDDYPKRAFWHRDGFNVISAVETIDNGSQRPEYHISISRPHPTRGTIRRCDSNDARWVLKQFGLEGSKEDNHVPGGKVRNFWRAVAEPLIGLDCECVAEEPAIVEDKGDYVWRGAPRP